MANNVRAFCLVTLLYVAILLFTYTSMISFDDTKSLVVEDSFGPPLRYDHPKWNRGFVSDTDIAEDVPAPFLEDEDLEEVYEVAKPTKISRSDANIRIRDFVPLPVPPNVLRESEKRKIGINFDAIATKWELPDGSIDLLEQIQSRTVGFDYNKTTDILSLRHPLKTGGTSFSLMMKSIYGERVVPGSGQSEWWQRKRFEMKL